MHVRIHSNNRGCSLRLNTRPLEKLVELNVDDDVLKLFAHPQQSTSFNKIERMLKQMLNPFALFKDGAYYCYCAYVLRISRYSDFLSVMLTKTGIFSRGLKLSGKSRS